MSSENALQSGSREYSYGFSTYGVKIGLTAFSKESINEIKSKSVDVHPFIKFEIEFDETDHRFEVKSIKGEYITVKNGEIIEKNSGWEQTLQSLEHQVKIVILECAVSNVFIHAGAVSYKDAGIIFPAHSYQGKSRLTAAMVKAGATYYSDDNAVLDENALLYPYPKQLSIRGIEGKFIQTDFPVEHFGGQTGIKPVEIKLIVITEYEKDYVWSPDILSPGNAVMELLNHTVIKFNPNFTLRVLHKLVKRAIILKSKRGEANLLASTLFDFLEKVDFEPQIKQIT